MELKSSSSSPFADVIFADEPTQKLSIPEKLSPSEDAPEPCIIGRFNLIIDLQPFVHSFKRGGGPFQFKNGATSICAPG